MVRKILTVALIAAACLVAEADGPTYAQLDRLIQAVNVVTAAGGSGGVDASAVRAIVAAANVTNAGAVAEAEADAAAKYLPIAGGEIPIGGLLIGSSSLGTQYHYDGFIINGVGGFSQHHVRLPDVAGQLAVLSDISSDAYTNGGARAYIDAAFTTNNTALVETITNIAGTVSSSVPVSATGSSIITVAGVSDGVTTSVVCTNRLTFVSDPNSNVKFTVTDSGNGNVQVKVGVFYK